MYAFFVGDRGDAKITITILYRYVLLVLIITCYR